MNWIFASLSILVLGSWKYRTRETLFSWQKQLLLLTVVDLMAAVCASWYLPTAFAGIPYFLLLNFLCMMTVEDIRTRQIQTLQIWLMLLTGAICALASGAGWLGRVLLFAVLLAVLQLAARRTNSGIGTGDAKVIAALALFLRFRPLFYVLSLSLVCALLYGLGLVVCKKATVKTELPFLPFLLAGALIGCWP